MNLKHEVYFSLNTDLAYYYNFGDFRTTTKKDAVWARHKDDTIKKQNELIEYIQMFCAQVCVDVEKRYIDKKTHKIGFQRCIYIFDADDKQNYQSHRFYGEYFPFILSTTGNLIYPSDVNTILHVPFYFKGTTPEISKMNKDVPLYIEKYDEYHASIRALTAQDTVVDKKLNQIWPIATGKPPVSLVELLNKTTETVR